MKNKNFGDFYSSHLTQTFKKSTFKLIWKKEYEALDDACHNKFRADNDLGTAICRYWQLLSGQFIPSKIMGKYFIMSNENKKLIKSIEKNKYKIICINDANTSIDFEKAKTEINKSFEKILNEKSSFEK